CEQLSKHLGKDLRGLLFSAHHNVDEIELQLTQTHITQCAIFVIEYSLARLWMHCGIRPEAMIGHSIGEYVAACLAGVFSLEDSLRLVAARGRLVQSLAGGAMIAVPLSEPELSLLLGDQLSLAATNAPSLCVAAGPSDAVDRLAERLEEEGLTGSRLQTSHAFH